MIRCTPASTCCPKCQIRFTPGICSIKQQHAQVDLGIIISSCENSKAGMDLPNSILSAVAHCLHDLDVPARQPLTWRLKMCAHAGSLPGRTSVGKMTAAEEAEAYLNKARAYIESLGERSSLSFYVDSTGLLGPFSTTPVPLLLLACPCSQYLW